MAWGSSVIFLMGVKPNTHRRRRRDETRQFRLVGVGGVYWALEAHQFLDKAVRFTVKKHIHQNVIDPAPFQPFLGLWGSTIL